MNTTRGSALTAEHAPFWQPRPGHQARRHTRLAPVPGTGDDLDILLEEISPGHAVFSTHTRVMGGVHGPAMHRGPCSTLLDFALGAAVTSRLGPDSHYRVLEFRMVNVGPRTLREGVVRAVANVMHPGSRGLCVGGRVFDSSGALLAVGFLIAVVEADDRED